MATTPAEPDTAPFRAEHARRSSAFELPLPCDRAFELFTPEGERAWAEGWDPQYLYPEDGRAAAGMVFRTYAHGEETVWMMTRFEPASSAVSYVRCTPGSRIATIDVACDALGPQRCEVRVTYEFTGLSPAGNEWLRGMDDARYAAFIEEWKAAIEKALAAR